MDRKLIALLKKLILFVATFTIFAYFLQSFVDAGLVKNADYREWDDLFHSRINADLLIQGSSRAWVHVSPKVLDSALKLNSYNLGMDGHNFLMQYYRFQLYLNYNKKPKYIIQTVDTSTLDRRKDLYGIEQFVPYLKYPLMRKAVSYYEGFEYVDYLLPAVKYRHQKDIVFTGIREHFQPSPSYKYKGFEAKHKKWDDSFSKFKANNPEGVRANVDRFTDRLFDRFMEYCRAHGITVVLVYTPEYIGAQRLITNRAEVVKVFKEYSARYGAAFLDYSDSYICYDTDNFYNSQHLNAQGVDKFNAMLASDLASILTPPGPPGPALRWPRFRNRSAR